MKNILLAFVGYSAGVVVSSAIAAFITLLQLIPRLVQFTETRKYIKLYEWIFTLSSFIFTILYYSDFSFRLNKSISFFGGLLNGVFIGIFASALAEVLNVIPVLCKKFKLNDYMFYLIVSLVLGKVFGSIFYWLSFIKYK